MPSSRLENGVTTRNVTRDTLVGGAISCLLLNYASLVRFDCRRCWFILSSRRWISSKRLCYFIIEIFQLTPIIRIESFSNRCGTVAGCRDVGRRNELHVHVEELRGRWRLVPATGTTWSPSLRRLHLPRGKQRNESQQLNISLDIDRLKWIEMTGRENQLHNSRMRRTGLRFARISRHQRMLHPLFQ